MLFCASLYLCLGGKKLTSVLTHCLNHLQPKYVVFFLKCIPEDLSVCIPVFQLKSRQQNNSRDHFSFLGYWGLG